MTHEPWASPSPTTPGTGAPPQTPPAGEESGRSRQRWGIGRSAASRVTVPETTRSAVMESGPDVYSPRLSHEVAASTATRSWVEVIVMGSGHSSGGRGVEVVDDEGAPPASPQPATG